MDIDKLVEAAQALYFAGVWQLQNAEKPENEQSKMWEALRDAMGLKPGSATQAGAAP